MNKRHKESPAVKAPGGIELSRSEVREAKHEGALDYVRESGGRAVAADTGTTGDIDTMAESQRLRVAPDLHSTTIAPLLNLSQDELSRRLGNANVPDHIDFETAKGLLHLERSGQNRTGYVKMLTARIGEEVGRKVHPHEVTNAGPPHTNDETSISEL